MSETKSINFQIINLYRAHTFNYKPQITLKNAEDAIDYVIQRGFIFFWPIKGIEFPSLWGAVAGNRPVANDHDDPGHVTWSWKDDLLGKKLWYYAKIIRQRSTVISLEYLPFFYALSPNFGNPEEDYFISYQDGILSNEERTIYEIILESGALDTISLRKAANLSSNSNSFRFSKALNLLQRDFRIMPVGISDNGAWHYSFIYDATHRYFPDLGKLAHKINEKDAMKTILRGYFQSLGASTIPSIRKFFNWRENTIKSVLEIMVNEQLISENIYFENSDEEWYTIRELI